jgi:trimeric autotransporter adhesin
MKHNSHWPLFASMLLPVTMFAGACSSTTTVDNNGKAISDLDIGGSITLDKGKTQQLSATVKYADGTTANVTTSVVWNVGDTDVATVSSGGLVTGVKVGATTIKATYQGKESASQPLIIK